MPPQKKPIRKQGSQSSKKLKAGKKRQDPDFIPNNGEPVLKNLTDFVTAIAVSKTHTPIYTGGQILQFEGDLFSLCRGKIVRYSLKEMKAVGLISHAGDDVENFCVTNTTKSIATFGSSELLKLGPIGNPEKSIHTVRLRKHFPKDMNFSKDGRHLAVGFSNSIVKIYTTETMKETHSYNCHVMAVEQVQWHPHHDLMQIVSCDFSHNLVVYDYLLNKVVAHTSHAGNGFALNSEGTLVSTVCESNLKLFHYRTLELIWTVDVGQYLSTLVIVGNTIYTGGEQSQLYSVSINQGKCVVHPNCTDTGIYRLLPYTATELIVVSTEQNLFIIDIPTHTVVKTIVGYNDEILDIRSSKAEPSNMLAMVTNSKNAKLVDKDTHNLRGLVVGHNDVVMCCDYIHPILVTAGKDKIIKSWFIGDNGQVGLVANYRGHSETVNGVAVTSAKDLIFSISEDKTLKVWPLCRERGTDSKVEVRSALATVMAHDKTINAVRCSADGQYVATCSHDRTAKVWTSDLSLVFTLSGHRRGVWDAAFHPVEALLVTVAGDGMLKGWNMNTGECTWSIGEGAGLLRCQWLYYNQVVTSSIDGIIKIWDIRKMTSLCYDKHVGRIWALDVSDKLDNSKVEIVSGGVDSTILTWRDSTEDERLRIIQGHEVEEQHKMTYQQCMMDERYFEAAQIAFEYNYTQLLLNVFNEVTKYSIDKQEFTFTEQGFIQIPPREAESTELLSDSDFGKLATWMCEKDLSRFYWTVESMMATVRHFKIASRLLLGLVRTKGIKWAINCRKSFEAPPAAATRDEFTRTEGDFTRLIHQLALYSQKHQRRIQKHIQGTYWIEHLHSKTVQLPE